MLALVADDASSIARLLSEISGGPGGIRTHDSRIKSTQTYRAAAGPHLRSEFRGLDRRNRLIFLRIRHSSLRAVQSAGFDSAIVRLAPPHFNGWDGTPRCGSP